VEDNAAEIVSAMRACEERLRSFREALERRDDAATREMLELGRDWFDGDPAALPIPAHTA
jgi:hypothetical protein